MKKAGFLLVSGILLAAAFMGLLPALNDTGAVSYADSLYTATAPSTPAPVRTPTPSPTPTLDSRRATLDAGEVEALRLANEKKAIENSILIDQATQAAKLTLTKVDDDRTRAAQVALTEAEGTAVQVAKTAYAAILTDTAQAHAQATQAENTAIVNGVTQTAIADQVKSQALQNELDSSLIYVNRYGWASLPFLLFIIAASLAAFVAWREWKLSRPVPATSETLPDSGPDEWIPEGTSLKSTRLVFEPGVSKEMKAEIKDKLPAFAERWQETHRLSYTVMVFSNDKIFTQPEYKALQDALVLSRLAVWTVPGVPTEGITFTPLGLKWIQSLLPPPPPEAESGLK